MTRISIIGLGLIGGSIGLALKQGGGSDPELVGFDADASVMAAAKGAGAVDRTVTGLDEAVAGAELVIVAVPPISVEGVFHAIAPRLAEGAVVTDTASTKGQVLRWAERHLPASVAFVGGHPMAGKSDQGIGNADATLFHGRPYVLVPADAASETAVSAVVGLVERVGGDPLFIGAMEHDQLVGAVSHLPLVASTALFTLLRRSAGWNDFARVAGPAYRDLTRLAAGDPQMSVGICATNSNNLRAWIDRYIDELQRLRDLLEGSPEVLLEEFETAQRDRADFVRGPPARVAASEPIERPTIASSLGTLLLGGRLYERLRGLASVSGRTSAGRTASSDR
ncbi:MAG: prephenate dehydrogenase/arogenate dehydrogenase family protein [Chloroflexi bacterium]|nr:prephenate dehydrogenase/arogenate dehydrogenase family protein [Chloroflexota bacterium]